MVRKTLLKVLVAGVVFGCVAKIIRDRVCGEDTFCFDEEYPDDDNGARGKDAEETGESPSLDDAPGKTISMPPSIERISAYAFHGNNYIEYMELPEGVKEIGRSAFEDCENMKYVNFPKGLEEIGAHAFDGCENMKRINLPDGLKSIGNNALSETSVTEVIIPDSVEELGEYVFSRCKKLRKVTMPGRFKNLPKGFFYACPNLEEIVFTEE